jgi:FixJ family two-component response regulator
MSSVATVPIATTSTPIPFTGFSYDLYRGANSHTASIVFVVDDDIHIRESLEVLIRSRGWQPQICDSVGEFLAQPRPNVPSCLILGCSSNNSNGLEMQRRIAREYADTPIIIIADYGDVPTTVQAMRAGAVDFLVKPLALDYLSAAIAQSLVRSRAALDRGSEMRDLRNCYASLTPRERQVLALVATGLPNKRVGAELGISEITVKAHRGQMMQKMKADSFAHLMNMALKLRLGRQPKAALLSM